MEFAVEGPWKKIIRHVPAQGKQPRRDEVFCVDDQKVFNLTRTGPNTDYLVKSVMANDSRGTIPYNGGIGRLLQSPFALVGRPLVEYLKGPRTRFKSTTPVVVDGHECYKLEFDFGEPASPATVVVDPTLGWVIRASEVRLADLNNISIRAQVDYQTNDRGEVVPSRIIYHDLDLKEKRLIFRGATFDSTPLAEFKLASFGLPELQVGPTPQLVRRSYAPWLAGLAVVGFVVAFVVRRGLTRTNRVPA